MSSDCKQVTIRDKTFTLFLTRAEIEKTIRRIGEKISTDYRGKDIAIVVVLKGAAIWAADLVRCIDVPCEIEYIRASSYGQSTVSSGTVALELGAPSLRNKDVLIIEDIIETGCTISSITQRLKAYSPNSVRIATLFFKPDVCRVPVNLAYIGFEIPAKFIVGYGLDYGEQGRNLADVFILEDNNSATKTPAVDV